jgi:hypothetical protein
VGIDDKGAIMRPDDWLAIFFAVALFGSLWAALWYEMGYRVGHAEGRLNEAPRNLADGNAASKPEAEAAKPNA